LSVCLLDTSILCELLQIPGKCGSFQEAASELERKVQQGESLLLPLTAVLEQAITSARMAMGGNAGLPRKGSSSC
jgi:hypothetical protein